MDFMKALEEQRSNQSPFELAIEAYQQHFKEFPPLFGCPLTEAETIVLIHEAIKTNKRLKHFEDAFYGE